MRPGPVFLLALVVSDTRGLQPTRAPPPLLILAPLDPVSSAPGALQLYNRLSRESAVALASVQTFLLASGADTASQWMHGGTVDHAHVAAMATCASLFSGAMNVPWLRALEHQVPGTSARAVGLKSLADFAICAPVVNSLYLSGVPLLTSLYTGQITLDAACVAEQSGWSTDALACAMLLNLCTFQPWNLVQFACVPPRLRPLGGACVSATATVVLSGITLGYAEIAEVVDAVTDVVAGVPAV
eukprot:456725-Prymnesium_polylepis.1